MNNVSIMRVSISFIR